MTANDSGKRVIIIAPVGQDAALMAELLEAHGFRTEIAGGPAEACEYLSEAGALLLTDEALELPRFSDLHKALKAQQTWSELPVIVLTRGGESRLVKLLDLAAEAAGSVTLLERPMSTITLLRSVQVALRSRRRQYQVRDLLTREQVLRLEAEAANRLKDEFLATVSHELRTPLNAILGWATMMRDGKVGEATTARAIETIVRNAKAQTKLVEDLLDVSRMTSDNLRLDFKPVKLTSVVNSAVDSLLPEAQAKGVELELVLEVGEDRIQADAQRLQQVVWNLLSNAIKHSDPGERVQIKVEGTDSQARIIVSDTGQGISPDFLPHVFDVFRQADGSATRRHGGLGLGLAIARRIVGMHGGSISATSEGEAKGATFTVSIPVVSAHQNAVASGLDSPTTSSLEPPSIAADAANLSGIRVLAVDDEPDSREMLKAVLEASGADVMTAGSAGEAIEVLLGWKPDVLVSDIGMPGEDGYALIRQIRKLEAGHSRYTPAIALTGYVRREDRIRALTAGYEMFIPKPVGIRELAISITNLIGRAGSQASAEKDAVAASACEGSRPDEK